MYVCEPADLNMFSDIIETFLINKSKKNMLVMLVTSVFQVFYDVNASKVKDLRMRNHVCWIFVF